MLINAEKHLDIFKKIVEISRCFVQKIRTLLLSEKSSDFVDVVHLQGLEPWAH